MVDTVRTLAALQLLLADNVAGDISAQDIRDFLVSAAFSGASVYKSADQLNIGTSAVKITYNTSEYDTDSYFDDANDRMVVPIDGYYRVTVTGWLQEAGTGDRQWYFYVNGSVFSSPLRQFTGNTGEGSNYSETLKLSATDYVEAWIKSTDAGGSDIRSSRLRSVFQIERLGLPV